MGKENIKIIQLSEYFCSCERPVRKGIFKNLRTDSELTKS